MKRIILFVLTNLAVMVVLSITLNLLGVNRFLAGSGLNVGMLLVFSVVVGFTGSIISLLMSKSMAKFGTGAHVIETPQTADEQWLVGVVRRHAEKAGIGMPEVAIFEGEPNAFATGAFRDSSLVAVSTGLLASMTREEVDAVVGHEIAHIANGDMVTLALIQGVVNTFVVFLARVVGYFVDKAILRNERDDTGPGYYITVIVCEIVFGILASMIVMWFSRYREFKADAGSAALMGSPRPMIAALRRLGGVPAEPLPETIRAFGMTDRPGWMMLFSSHPPIEDRIAALENRTAG